MSIIKVTTNVLEDYQVTTSVQTPFNPFIVAKFPSGPVGEWVKISNIRELTNTFGKIDASLPTAYGIKEYLEHYSPVYLYRVAAKTSAKGAATLSFNDGTQDVDLLKIETKYKTQQLNGSVIEILKEVSYDQIYIKITTPTTSYRTVGVEFDVTTDSADKLSEVLDTLVTYINSAQQVFTVENLFKDKINTDTVPADYTALSATVAEGNSGNDDKIDDQVVIDSLGLLEEYDIVIDAILAPEFNSVEVIEALTVKADLNDYVYICSPDLPKVPEESPEQSATRFVSFTDSLKPSKSRILYYPAVYYNALNDNGVIVGQVEIPLAIAVLRTYAINDDIGKWYAPEGISDEKKRGLLTSAVSTKFAVTTEAADILYNAKNPVNYLQSISGIGIIVLGNKTTYSESKVFSKIHVVRLSKYLHRVYQNIGLDYIGEPIDDFTYEDFASRLRNELDKIVAARGLEGYQVKCDAENNTEEMRQDGIIYTMSRLKFYNIAEVIENDLIFSNYLEESDEGGGNRV